MRDLVFAVFMVGLIPFILTRPFVGLLVWSWLGYMNPHRLCFGFAYSFPWVMVVAIITMVSILFSSERKKIPLSPYSVLLVVFLLWTVLTTSYAFVPDAAWDQWQVFAKILVMVFVTLMLVNTKERMQWVVWMIVVSLCFYGMKGGLSTIVHRGGGTVLGPPDSFIANNNDLAQALCMTLPLIRYLQLQASRKYMKLGLGFAMFLTGIGILGTYSRGGLIALVVVTGALFLKGRRRIVLGVMVLAVAFAAYHFMPAQWTTRMDTLQNAGEIGSLQTRIQSWEFAANVAIHRPLIGGGFMGYESAAMWSRYAPAGAIQRAVHSIYFRVLAEQGFPGLAMFLALLLVSWLNCTRVRRITEDSAPDKWAFDLASMLQVSLLAFMTAGAASTSSYFDLSYQLMAMCALLPSMLGARSTAAARAGRTALVKVGALHNRNVAVWAKPEQPKLP